MIDYAKEPLRTYLDHLAAKQETPGGGSVAALVGALAAGLGSMVCNFTIGKKKYADVEGDIRRILARCEEARKELLTLMQEDVNIFQTQMATAYALPKDTEEQTAARREAIEKACKSAAQPPIKTIRLCRNLLKLMTELGEKGSTLLVSDVGVAAALAQAAFDSARLNVDINLNYLSDKAFAKKVRDEIEPMIDEVQALSTQAMTIVREKLHKN